MNRIINLQSTKRLIENIDNVNDLCSVWRNNYGFAGKMFIDYVKTIDREVLIEKYNNYLNQFLQTGGTGKQSMSGAMLMLADELANDCIFKDDLKLTINDFQGIILSETEVSRAERLYETVSDWVASNERHFNGMENVDQWGKLQKDSLGNVIQVQVIKTILDQQFFKDINSKAILTEWKKSNYIDCIDENYTKTLRINNIVTRAVFINLKNNNKECNKMDFTEVDDEQLIF